MTRRAALLVLVLGLVVALTTVSFAASQDASPQQQIANLKAKLRLAQLKASDLQNEVDAQDQLLSDQGDTIARLRYRLANQPDPVDVITNRSPDDQWAAMVAIWRAFPTLDPGALCGYDRSNVPGGSDGLSLTSYTFYRWSGC